MCSCQNFDPNLKKKKKSWFKINFLENLYSLFFPKYFTSKIKK